MKSPQTETLAAGATSRALAWLGDEHKFWPLFTAMLGTFAALKGLRLPGVWAFTQSLADYSHGFVKRGLLGAIYGAFGIYNRRGLTVMYFLELILLMALLVAFTRRTGLVQRVGTGAVAALFAGSYAVTYLFHLIGYSDILNASLTVALLLVRKARTRFLLALPLLACGLLIHEDFLLLFTPVLLLSFYLQGATYLQGAASPDRRRRIWSYGLILGAVALGITLFTSLRTPMEDEQVDAFATYIYNRADFEVREDFFQVFTNSLGGNFAMMSRFGWHGYLWWTFQAVSICVLGPPLALLLHFCMRLVRQAGPQTRGLKPAVLLAALSPLCMHLLGLDQVRWNTWVVLDAYLALGVLAMHLPGERLRVSAGERNTLVLAIAIGMASGHGLFNGTQVNPYPFFPKLTQGWIERHDGPLPGFRKSLHSE